MASYGLQTNYDLAVSIGVSSSGTPPTWTYASLEDGIDNISEALNEVVQQYQFLSDKGFAKNHVTGVAPSFTFTGKRVYGDTAQDFIFGTKYQLDTGRKSSLKIVDSGSGTAATLTVDCTICNIQEYGGAATDDQSISFELRFDGQPTIA